MISKTGIGYKRKDGYIQVVVKGKDVLMHKVIVEGVIGRRLKSGEVVHHIDGNRSNNENNNLLICTQEYHRLIHKRQRALDMSGNPNNEWCWFCKKHDDKSKMSKGSNAYFHTSCKVKYNASLKERNIK